MFLLIFNNLNVSHICIIQNSFNCAVAAQLQMVSYHDKSLSDYAIIDILIRLYNVGESLLFRFYITCYI